MSTDWQKIINTLDLLADLFSYPDEDFFLKLEALKKIHPELHIPKKSLLEMQTWYIKYFDLYSTKFSITPVASMWLNGKTMSSSTQNIEDFYLSCGYSCQNQGFPDHISNLLCFWAILLEEEKFDLAEKFSHFLSWTGDFKLALSKIKDEENIYYQLINILEKGVRHEIGNC